MPSEQTITHDFDRLLAQYPGFFEQLVAYVQDIRVYGSVKQAISEAEQRLRIAKEGEAAFQANLLEQQTAKEAQWQEKERWLVNTVADQEKGMAEQKAATAQQARDIIQSAKTAAAQVLTEAEVARAAVDRRVSTAQSAAASLETDIKQKQEAVAGLDATIAQKQAALDKIEAARQALLAKIAS